MLDINPTEREIILIALRDLRVRVSGALAIGVISPLITKLEKERS